MARKDIIKSLCLVGIAIFALTGCSDDDPTSPGNPVDTAPPAVPASVTAQLSDGGVTVSWAPNTVDADLAGYVVERDNYGQLTVLTPQPITVASYEDAYPQAGSNTYRVYAVDNAGNQSAVATSEIVILRSHRPGDLGEG